MRGRLAELKVLVVLTELLVLLQSLIFLTLSVRAQKLIQLACLGQTKLEFLEASNYVLVLSSLGKTGVGPVAKGLNLRSDQINFLS